MAEQESDGIEALWPTMFMRRTLPGADLANQALAAYILELEDANLTLATDYLRDNLLVADHPAVAWLRDCVNRTIADYFRALGIAYQIDWTLHGWANVNRLGDYHDPPTTRTAICPAPITCRCRRTARSCARARMCAPAASPSTTRLGRR
jgi:hypothetical protein